MYVCVMTIENLDTHIHMYVYVQAASRVEGAPRRASHINMRVYMFYTCT